MTCSSEVNTTRDEWNEEDISGYHFHTYFFQNNVQSSGHAERLRTRVETNIANGLLNACITSEVYYDPVGPHPVGMFITCCNKTSMTPALSWFVQNHGNLSVLIHPLTREVLADHTDKATFLGKSMPLDLPTLPPVVKQPLKCIPEHVFRRTDD
ncbi:unnamed protein product [Medioppia subpectinata]|uniref:DOPA 4,5-dioxygenase n=1 Tax=Medioppia subpectinata TaxID=1979941 RepID=A0A7R9L5E4_9ACAR|nr:unnamed protein product [Medioppia subpectinata]CAG2115669.1 unnamed protein product [Medioppia subpectinata]